LVKATFLSSKSALPLIALTVELISNKLFSSFGKIKLLPQASLPLVLKQKSKVADCFSLEFLRRTTKSEPTLLAITLACEKTKSIGLF